MSSEKRYKEAYDLHYKTNDLDAAERVYRSVIEDYPESKEAGYATTQLENIAEARNPPEVDVSALEPDSLEGKIAFRFLCPKCNSKGANTKRLALARAGAGRLFDVQNHFYLAVTCRECGFTELYDLNLLEGRGGLGSAVLDLVFGAS